MRILFVLENYFPNVGGVETLFKNHLENLAAQGYQVTLVTTKLFKDSPKFEYQNNLTIYRYNFLNRYFFTFFAFFAVYKHSKKVDLIHTTSYNAGLPALLGGLLRNKKVIITFHEVWGKLWFKLPFTSKLSSTLFYLFEKMLLKLPFHKFVGVSQSTVNALIENGVAKNKVELVYNGVDYTKFENYKKLKSSEANEKFTISFFGRLGISKGLDVIIEAATTLKKMLPNINFKLIVPKNPAAFYNKIMQLLKEKDLENYFEFHHQLTRKQLVEQIVNSNCVVIPSYSEGFCFAAAECAALNIPIISSNKTALKEVVSGQFIKMEELNADALLNAIKNAYEGNWQKSELKKFELKDCIESYIQLYKKELNN